MVLPVGNRMRSGADFTRAVRSGRRSGQGRCAVHVVLTAPITPRPRAGRDPRVTEDSSAAIGSARVGAAVRPARVGFVVPRSVGPAVQRNLVKRRMRAVMAARAADLPDGCLVVVRANPGAAAVPFQDLARDLEAALRRALERAPLVPVGA